MIGGLTSWASVHPVTTAAGVAVVVSGIVGVWIWLRGSVFWMRAGVAPLKFVPAWFAGFWLLVGVQLVNPGLVVKVVATAAVLICLYPITVHERPTFLMPPGTRPNS